MSASAGFSRASPKSTPWSQLNLLRTTLRDTNRTTASPARNDHIMPARARNHSGDVLAFNANTIVIPGGCHIWTGGHASNGYGVHQAAGKPVLVHRWALSQALGHDLLPGEIAQHQCDRRDCVAVGPGHLRVGSKKSNSADMVEKGRAYNGDSRKTVTIKEVVEMADMRAAGSSWYAIGLKFNRDQQVVKRQVEAYLAGKKKPVSSVTVMSAPVAEQGMAVAA